MSEKVHDRLSKLPNELLVLIFQQSTNFSSVWSLMHTSSYLASVFNDHACLIVNAVLNTKVPSQSRALIQGVLTLHKGTFLSRTPEDELYYFDWSEVPLLPSVSATSSDMRWLVRLAHHVHNHAHLYIEVCMQRCLQSRLGDRNYSEGFKIPTWTEEQRGLLGFWRLIFVNQLREESQKGSLRWPPQTIDSLKGGMRRYGRSSLFCTMQTTMALDYLTGYYSAPKSQLPSINSMVLRLPPVPAQREFGWHCQPLPTWQAISQGQEPDEILRMQIKTTNTPFDAESDQLAPRLGNQLESPLVVSEEEPAEELEEEPADETNDETEEKCGQSNQVANQEARRDANQGRVEQSDGNLDPRTPRYYFGPPSSSSESSDDVDLLPDEDEEGRSDEDEHSDDDERSSRRGAYSCILRDVSDTDSQDYEYPGRLEVRNRPVSQYVARPVRDFGPNSTVEECLDLERWPLGLQFWDSMILNPEGGPGKYMRFDAYARYGFLLWEEWRMIEFGLWSNKPIEDMSVYYHRWFRFLSPEDMSFHSKFRYSWDDDWL
ncbi:hypothetical protein N7520_008495 [Penicillium odoratum]|uniref:uncharacterized protein n=1 Tax=Penicillium odoratum TaxID=1167516 RepID=UPI00254800FF|nr:uncharacterized protein N7520_008495 [Penicillium odoratum]KAJ5751578.1 hypothetical protein N7520_008495 [Penicillium odoratum]